jgi:hypothetical protein
MAINKRIPTTELDFDEIKSNLKTFLQGQSEFADYDFDGSALSVILDVLAYNTHYNALYKNLAVNESFLDSASKRASVVSRAKEIGYIPRSAKSAEAVVDVVVSSTTSTPTSLILPAYSPFNTSIDGVTYTFYTLNDTITIKDTLTSTYTFSDVTIKEGTPLTFKYVVSEGQKYIIPNSNVDLSTLTVRVQDNTTGVYTTFTNQENIINITGTDAVFFVKEIDDELYELQFGNGVIGKALANGNIVHLNYIVCNKTLPNGAKTFSYQGSTLLGGIVSTVTQTVAFNGSDIEDIESIRFNAPRAYSTQNRAVTVDDYKAIIYANYPTAESINVWGGEDNDPPIYGKVFISIKPVNAQILTQAEKDYVKREILKKKNVVTITPELVDANYINLKLDITAYYNPRLTVRTAEQLKTLVHATVTNYNDTYLNKFDGIFRYSKLSSLIDATEDSIVSNIMTLTSHREIEVKYNIASEYLVNTANPIYNSGVPENSVLSTGFYISGNPNEMFLEDLPTLGSNIGTFRMFYYVGTNKTYIKNIGTIDYDKGIMFIPELTIVGLPSATFEFMIKTQSNDVVSIRNQLVLIPEENITINMILDRVAAGDAAGNTNFVFTSSRN